MLPGNGVGVLMAVGVAVGGCVGVGDVPGVAVAADVGVLVGVLEAVGGCVGVGDVSEVAVAVDVGVNVGRGVTVGVLPLPVSIINSGALLVSRLRYRITASLAASKAKLNTPSSVTYSVTSTSTQLLAEIAPDVLMNKPTVGLVLYVIAFST